MDLLVGHRLAKGRPQHDYLQTGDTVDSWKVIIVEEEQQLTLLFWHESPRSWSFKFLPLAIKATIVNWTFAPRWHPHGMPGLFYWLLMIPAHLFIFFAAWRDASPAVPSKITGKKTKIKRYSFMILIAYSGESRKKMRTKFFSGTVD